MAVLVAGGAIALTQLPALAQTPAGWQLMKDKGLPVKPLKH